jgi:hypothetical protein
MRLRVRRSVSRYQRGPTVDYSAPAHVLMSSSPKMPSMAQPNFADLSRVEERLLTARLEAIRASISHAGEKGRAVEHAVQHLIRSFLPTEYGLSSGFIAALDNGRPVLSTQLDIVIYDALRSGPLIRLDTCDVFPLEAVYGYVEVKAQLTQGLLDQCLAQNGALRRFSDRRFWQTIVSSPISVEPTGPVPWHRVRAFLVALEAGDSTTKSLSAFAAALDERSRLHHALIHGVFVAGVGAVTDGEEQTEFDETAQVRQFSDSPLLRFKTAMLKALASFRRLPADHSVAIDAYFDPSAATLERSPKLPEW